ncbi:unnamed protein product [Owenia fusiformis]|uniref:Uncharacterized protein n=1 Tax=Owenia fusiformis TaxID=6347 RepID=A0A8J1Y4M9_OWEFU|nr:unnamed protein product [Owenia fusiformis]
MATSTETDITEDTGTFVRVDSVQPNDTLDPKLTTSLDNLKIDKTDEIPCLEKLEKKFHAFVVHSSTDSDFVNNLIKDLENKGLKIMYADRDFTLGQTILGNISMKINESHKMILVCSKGLLESHWARYEAALGVQESIDKQKHFIHVIKHEVDEVPLNLRWLTYVDSKDDDMVDRLFKAIIGDGPLYKRLQRKDVGYGMAWSYFYSYLNVIVPSQPKTDDTPGYPDLGERIKAHKAKPENANILMPEQIFIMVPETGQCPNNISATDDRITADKKDVLTIEVNRAGSKRPYKNQIWTIKEDGKTYQALVEFATVLYPLVEMEKNPQAQLSAEERLCQVQMFYEELTQILAQFSSGPNVFERLVKLVVLRENDNVVDKVLSVIKYELEEEAKDMNLA